MIISKKKKDDGNFVTKLIFLSIINISTIHIYFNFIVQIFYMFVFIS